MIVFVLMAIGAKSTGFFSKTLTIDTGVAVYATLEGCQKHVANTTKKQEGKYDTVSIECVERKVGVPE